MNYVKFLRGTPAAFDRLVNKDKDTLYFISEQGSKEGLLYLGDKLILGQNSIEDLKLDDIANIIIDKANLHDGSILVYDWEKQAWVNTSIEEVANRIMTGASSEKDGLAGLVPAPKAGDENKFLRGDGIWAVPVANLSEEDAGKISELHAIIDALVGDSAISGTIPSIKKIAASALSEMLIPENASETLDTLKEISEWIQEHPIEFAQVSEDIASLNSKVENLENITKVEGGLFVLNSTFDTTVGDLNTLITENHNSLMEEINDINERLSWSQFK